MNKHIIKRRYEDGVELKTPILWCGEVPELFGWQFQDAQHAALTPSGGPVPCEECVQAIIKGLKNG